MKAHERHEKATELFLQAIELPPDERQAMIAERCAGHTDILQDVMSLLRHDFPEPAALPVDAGVEEESLVGRTLGRYEIVGDLGRGAMGVVWKANDTVLERAVALKFLPQPDAESQRMRKRFLREARAAAALKHPNIATVYDAGEVDGRVFIAMEHVAGRTLSQHIAEGPLSPARAVAVAAATARALDYAHGEGIIHRDIAPKNVMIDASDRVTIVDFGLALKEGITRTTAPGVMVGTVAYIAPELFFDAEPGRQSDIYSLGVTLYEMLTGHLPWPARHPHDLINSAIHYDHEPPGALVAGLPAALDGVVARAMAKEPGDRFATAGEMAEALEAIARAEALSDTAPTSVRAPVPTQAKTAGRGRVRRPVAPLLVAAIVVFLLIVIGWLVTR